MVDSIPDNLNIVNIDNPKDADTLEYYDRSLANRWISNEINFDNDRMVFINLSKDMQHYYKYTLAFFLNTDSIVNDNCSVNFESSAPNIQARLVYIEQESMESVHMITYHNALKAYIPDLKERQEVINLARNDSSIRAKIEWAVKWMGKDVSITMGQKRVAFCAIEGVLFSSSFCAIFFAKKQGIRLDGLIHSNELISRDENLHTEFGAHMYKKYDNRLPQETVYAIFKEAVELEKEFVKKSLPVTLVGIQPDQMCQYVEYVADHVLQLLGYPAMYKTRNPFDWMSLISMHNRPNFFERRTGSYEVQKGTKILGFDEIDKYSTKKRKV